MLYCYSPMWVTDEKLSIENAYNNTFSKIYFIAANFAVDPCGLRLSVLHINPDIFAWNKLAASPAWVFFFFFLLNVCEYWKENSPVFLQAATFS